ncbi:phage tail protein [Paraburkholderia sacchari]|uniref:phage tail protein n=1 Tax=Paraburkholderia sacchari TaxID=159450 RepID=UPI001BD05CA0|nr:phage tail protein [Paraburkholderia sacchari]
MGQSVGLLLGVAGAAIGGVLSGGASLAIEAGFLAGSLLGSILFPPKGPAPSDLRVQDSAYGKWIPRVYGRYRMAGNIIWLGTPHNHSSSGKGMGGKTQGPYTTVSFAVGLCDGPIVGINRIWANGKLIYDVSNPADYKSLSGSSSMVTGFTVYKGDELQEADPTMESQLGASNVPAYRGLAYVVFNELNLQQWGNYLPSFTFEVIAAGQPSAYSALWPAMTFPPSGIQSPTMSHMATNGGTVMAQWNSQVFVGTVNPYAAFQTGSVNVSMGIGLPAAGVSDVAGTWQGEWIQADGTVVPFTNNTGMTLGLAGSGNNFWKNGNDIYIASSYVGCYSIYRCDISPGGVVGLSGLGLIKATYTSGTSQTFVLIGGTASYVYALTGSNILQLDRNTLALVNTFNINTVGVSVTCGGVLDDDHLYVCNPNGATYLYQPSTGVTTFIGTCAVGNGMTVFVPLSETLFLFNNGPTAGTFRSGYMAITVGATAVTVGAVVTDLLERAGLTGGQFDTSQLTDTIIGFSVTGNSTTRDCISPLQESYFFDVSDSDGMLKFPKRGGAPVLTIPWDDLGASSSDNDSQAQNPISETIAQEFELPRTETITYVSASTDYGPGTQREPHPSTTSNLDEAVNVPIVMADNEAKVRVQTMLWERWTKRVGLTTHVGRKYLALEPGDVIGLTAQSGSVYTVRITKVQNDGKGVLEFTCDPSVSAIYPNFAQYTAQGGNALGFKKQAVEYSGPTVLQVMDLPPLRTQDATSPGLYAAACGYDSTWPGCILDMSRDDVAFTDLFTITSKSAIGVCATALPNWQGGEKLDSCSTVSVQLFDVSQSLSSVTYAQLINGANPALIGNELVYFMTATQTGPGQYTLSNFLRGRNGTGPQIANHAGGDRFVFLNAATLATFSINAADAGQPLYFEAFLNNLFASLPSTNQTVSVQNARVQPFAPHLFKAFSGSTSSSSDITLRWLRRARINFGWLDGTDVPLDESAENYTVSVYNGATLMRQTVVPGPFIAPNVPSWVYPAAQISADGFVAGNTITLAVQQHSDQGVMGQAATTTITR